MTVHSLHVGSFEASVGGCSVCHQQDVLVATDDYCTTCAACLRRVADALDRLQSALAAVSNESQERTR